MTADGPPIVVAGAGIGGLAAALCLARAGRPVAVLERAAAIEEIGAGLQIAPNAGRLLQQFGLGDALDAAALFPRAINIRRMRDGARLARLDLAEARARWGAPFRIFHRADLQQLLLNAAQNAAAIALRVNARVGDFEEDDGIVHLRVHGDQGPEDVEASALIGADGVRSSVRAILINEKGDAPAYTGHTAWRAILPAAEVPAALREKEVHGWLGPGAHAVNYPLRDGAIVNAVIVLEDGKRVAPDGPPTLSGAELLRLLGSSCGAPELVALIGAGASWRRWPLYARPALKRWSHGAVTLLGDAAHPMLPFLAQGAAQAIEDAAALGRAFATGAAPAEALKAYEAERLARATQVQRRSRRQGRLYHAAAPFSLARDAALRLLGGPGVLARNAWLYR